MSKETEQELLEACEKAYKTFSKKTMSYGSIQHKAIEALDKAINKARKEQSGTQLATEDTTIKGSEAYGCNHHHEIKSAQKLVNFGTGEFVADNKRIALLKALNDCGLITRTHCYGHETGHSFIAIIFDNDLCIEVRKITERNADRTTFNGKTELLLQWKRTD